MTTDPQLSVSEIVSALKILAGEHGVASVEIRSDGVCLLRTPVHGTEALGAEYLGEALVEALQ